MKCTMATLTLTNVPADVYRGLREAAARNHRSLDEEAVSLLAASVSRPPSDAAPKIAELRALREHRGLWVDHAELDALIAEGRD